MMRPHFVVYWLWCSEAPIVHVALLSQARKPANEKKIGKCLPVLFVVSGLKQVCSIWNWDWYQWSVLLYWNEHERIILFALLFLQRGANPINRSISTKVKRLSFQNIRTSHCQASSTVINGNRMIIKPRWIGFARHCRAKKMPRQSCKVAMSAPDLAWNGGWWVPSHLYTYNSWSDLILFAHCTFKPLQKCEWLYGIGWLWLGHGGVFVPQDSRLPKASLLRNATWHRQNFLGFGMLYSYVLSTFHKQWR